MIPSGSLFELAGEARREDTKPERLREMCIELIDNTHRLHNLIVVACRRAQEHDEFIEKLDALIRTSPGREGG